MKFLVVDIESSLHHPFSRSGKLMCVGCFDGNHYDYFDIEHSALPYGETLRLVKAKIEQAETIIGHNVKFDINWLRRYIPDLKINRVWDTQLFEYISSDQTWPMPSLNDSLLKHGLPGKSDYVATEYWDKGIDTMFIPRSILEEYNRSDCELTFKLYTAQLALLRPEQRSLFQLHCDDLLVLQDMELNGMLFDTEECIKKQDEYKLKFATLNSTLGEFYPDVPINWNSNDHLSAVLYGGSVSFRIREVVQKTYKKGVKDVERWGIKTVQLPRLVEPLQGGERDKAGYFFVNEPTLRSLKPRTGESKRIIELVLELAEVEKLLNTYYLGLPKLIDQNNWPAGMIHGSFNQCVTRTGRSSSSKPNLQNFAGVIKHLFRSRYA